MPILAQHANRCVVLCNRIRLLLQCWSCRQCANPLLYKVQNKLNCSKKIVNQNFKLGISKIFREGISSPQNYSNQIFLEFTTYLNRAIFIEINHKLNFCQRFISMILIYDHKSNTYLISTPCFFKNFIHCNQ